jgi:hypothetical protein
VSSLINLVHNYALITYTFRWNIKKDKGTVMTYSITDIKHNVCGEMTRDGMILLSLLSGGDYNSVNTFAYFIPLLVQH